MIRGAAPGGGVGDGGGADHVLDGADAGDGVLGEGEGHGDGADEVAVDVDGAAAHSLHDAGVFEGSAGEAGEDQGFLRAEIIEDAENLDLNSSTRSPEKTVRPMPRMPARMSLSGKKRGLGSCRQRNGEREKPPRTETGHTFIVIAGEEDEFRAID